MNALSFDLRLAALAAAVVLAAGCGNGDRQYAITEKRELAEARPQQLVPADTQTRFGRPAAPEMQSPHGSMGGGMGAPSQPSLAFDLPEGWKEIPAAQFRSPNFAIPAREKLECYVSVLPGGGGGIAPNVNRWRKQMGLAELTDAEVAALPRVKVLGADAPFVEMEGSFKRAGAQDATPGYTMAAVAAERGGAVVTAKLVGPTEDVRAEIEHFKAMCGSLRSAAPAASAGGEGGESGALTWKAPEGWTQGPPKQMRLVTLNPDGRPGVECYVALLGGRAGGVEANINRWRQQLSLAPLPADAIAKLPTLPVLGRPSPFVEVDGGKLGMYGLVCELDGQTVFVKMTGPMDALRAERDRFVEFCKSLTRP